jgi:hypothetical protein
MVAMVMRHTPLNRAGKPEDIAGPAVFLASDMSAYVTGQHHHGRRRLPHGLTCTNTEGNPMQGPLSPNRHLPRAVPCAGENPTLAIERDMELVEHLDRLNYHEAWIGEHHSGGFEIIACPEMFLAAAAQRTRNIRLGTGVVSLPYHHPFTWRRA